MNFIDTHAHIYVDEMLKNKTEIISRAKQVGISKILMPNIDATSIPSMLSLHEEYEDFCLPMLGLHPCDVKEDYEKELETIFSQFSEKYIAIGEIGLDLYWDKTTLEWQTKAFEYQIEFAINKKLPISVHVRDAFPEILAILSKYKNTEIKGVIHCFTGTLSQAKEILDLGFYLGVGGVSTFKNAGVDKILANIELEHLILETDSPYLSPTPYRGKPNEPSYLPLIAQKLAETHDTTIENIATITTLNAKKLFNLN